MPRNGQIIPEFLHPHVKTYINDNTIFKETTSVPVDGVSFINVIASEKGRDGVVVECNTVEDYISEFGTPRFDLYGQPCLMPYASLSTGKAKCWVLRVMPSDAALSNLLVKAKVKVAEDPVSHVKSLVIKHETIYHEGLLNAAEFSTLSELTAIDVADADGWRTFPIFGFVSKGRGAYGNNFRVRVSPSLQADKDNQYKNYAVEVLEAYNGLQRKELFQGTLYANALDGNSTIYLEDLFNDVDGSTKLDMYVFDYYVNKIFEIYKAEVNPTTTLTLETFDLIAGLDKTGTAITDISIATTDPTHKPLDNADGVVLFGGTEGAFDVSNGAARETAMNAALIKAFEGQMDKAVTSKRRTPTDFILDANYADEVKRALIGLVSKRYDAYGYLDAGILETQTDVIDWASTNVSLSDACFSKDCTSYKIKDPFTGKTIAVTITYLFAQLLPNHIKQNGRQTPFVGEAYTKVTGAIKNSVRPIIDVDDSATKEALYESRVNYYECIGENSFIRATQTTSQNVWSDLSEENNMLIVLEVKRKIEDMVSGLTYNFADAEDRLNFTEAARRLFSSYVGTKVKSLDVYFDMSPWEQERSILHCYLAVQFKSLSKRGIIEIDINKRV